jgi:hypothetical protein
MTLTYPVTRLALLTPEIAGRTLFTFEKNENFDYF